MNGIEKIMDRIAQDGEQKARTLIAQAQAEAEEITASYEAKAREQSAEILAAGGKQAEEYISRQKSVAQLEARKLLLSAKQEMLARAFEEAKRSMLELPEKDYVNLLVSLALRAITKGTEELVFSHSDRNVLGKKVVIAANEALEAQGKTAGLHLAEEARDFQGGLYVKDGNIETNCTFDTLIRRQKEKMSGEVAAVLFS